MKSQDVLKKILDSTREGVLVSGSDMLAFAVNTAAYRSFSNGHSTIEGQPIDALTGSAEVATAFFLACTENKTSDIHLKYKRNGTRRYDVHVAPLDLDGQTNAIGFFYDVTQIHRLETIRQEFLSNISHELRTPLTSILAFVETLEEGALEDDENNRHFLGVIRRNGERMRDLIADILELSQIESGNIELRRKEIRLADVVDEILTSLSSMASAREITLSNDIGPSAVVRADKKRLEQMLTNLVDNAIRFNRRGGSVTLAYDRFPDIHQIQVFDTGEGILPDQIHRIFERFYRVDRARSRDIGGTGLGLSIVKHLARLHGGEVTVESELGVGTKFTISLPA
ncbi:hypothetical protein BH20ACI2_BH20ACI2_16020 [soil metagenome]